MEWDNIICACRSLPTDCSMPDLRTSSNEDTLNAFLQGVERRAFKRVTYAVRDDDAALDIVQDAMIRLCQSYADRPETEWPMLFQRILSNAILDWFRRQKTRNALFSSLGDLEARYGDEDGNFDLLSVFELEHVSTEGADAAASRTEVLAQIEEEIQKLPPRQREAFLLRYWEEMDVAETAAAMGCSEGSVKTHCSRAIHAMAQALQTRGISL